MTSSALPPYHQLQSNLYQQSQPNSTTTLSPPLPSSSSILMTKTTTERSTATSINQNNHLNYPLHPPPPSHHFQHQPSSSSSSSNSSVSSFVLFNNNSNNNSSSSNNNNSDLLQPPNHHFHLHSHYQSYLNPNQNSPQPNSFTSDSRTQLYVGNLPYRVRWQDLKDLFRKAGTVLRTDVSLTPENRSKGFGTVLFATRSDAQKAVEIYNQNLGGPIRSA
ncbi:hypothetical protein BY996DRAFT_3295930 [Phakopsora pachyrhizi]|uniref:Expressed protein n=1 Tax=Phakopsora pachyrhizi TaxID=170000 RepID=A0AAV0ASY5_PHAPC|nr:hypothetical protein BY996DRAFT_1620199 [Phakopsora pachyrhizi]KAI8459913.1 hypothetical protein BY996DRAFT_3295930 [Phakopsora pachyrhizi]CAH7671915.1 expressed protein [Phakopsora pachyrhizi]